MLEREVADARESLDRTVEVTAAAAIARCRAAATACFGGEVGDVR